VVSSIAVVSPPCTTARSQAAEVAIEVVHVGDDLEPVGLRQRVRVDARAGDDDHAQLRHVALGLVERGDHPAQQVSSDTEPAHAHDARPSRQAGSQVVAQLVAVAEVRGSKPLT
jgi:hypothetical protein